MTLLPEHMHKQLDPLRVLQLYAVLAAGAAICVFAFFLSGYVWRAVELTFFPVITESGGEMLANNQNGIVVRLWVTRSTRVCKYKQVQAYYQREDGYRDDVKHIQRLDIAERGDSKPPGAKYDIGIWGIEPPPTKDIHTSLWVSVKHDCDGREVNSLIKVFHLS